MGADERIFSFLDLSFCQPIFIKWIKPLKDESLEHYALRLAGSIEETSPTIIGISLGGMMATEIAKANPKAKVIIISSNKTSGEFPSYLKILIRYFPVYKLTSKFILGLMLKPAVWILGAKGKEQRKLLKQIILDSYIPFDRWAIGAIGSWKNETVPANVIHIHGTADKLLLYRNVRSDYVIKDGEHVMVMDRANEISSLLQKLIG